MTRSAPRLGVNLLDFRAVRSLVHWRWFPTAFQVITLACFVALLVLGWGEFAPDGVPAKLYAKSNLVNLLIWGVWWPVMIFVAVGFGRVWCTVCPLELVAGCGEKVSERLGFRRHNLSRWLRAGWLILLLYVVIQLLVAGVGLHRTPAYTSLFLAVLLLGAILVGLFFQHRAFCRGFCPVGLLLGTYGRGSMLAIRADRRGGDSDPGGGTDPEDGAVHADPVAYCGHEDATTVARSCPSLLNPPKLDSSKDCLICGACVKASQHDEMAIVLRRPFAAEDARDPAASWPVTLFVMVVSGFVTYELTTNWPDGKKLFLWPAAETAELLGLSAKNAWLAGAWKLAVWPVLLWTLLGGVTVLLGGAATIGAAWRRLALPMVLVVAAGHMAKGLEKLATWTGYLPGTLREPLGVETAKSYVSGALPMPGSLLSMTTLSVVGTLLIVSGLLFGLRELRLARVDGYARCRPALLLLAGLFGYLTFRWGA